MDKIRYDPGYYKEVIKEKTIGLSNDFKKFYTFKDSDKKKINQRYKLENISIASFLSDLVNKDKNSFEEAYTIYSEILEGNKNYEEWDIRDLTLYQSKLEENPDTASKINQKLIDLEKKLELEDSPETRFILFNAIKYSAKKEIHEFELIENQIKSKNIETLISTLKENFDIIEIPYTPNTLKIKMPIFKNMGFVARLTRQEFEGYVLKRLAEETAENLKPETSIEINQHRKGKLDEDVRKEIFKDISKLEVSDSAIEDFEKSKYCSGNIFYSLFLNHLVKNAKRTKLDLEFDGKFRDHMFENFNGKFRNLTFKNVGDSFMKESNAEIENLYLRQQAGNDFMLESNAEIENLYIKWAKNNCLAKSNMQIGIMRVGQVQDYFMSESDSKIDILKIIKARNNCMERSNLQIGTLNIEQVQDYCLYLSKKTKIGTLNILQAGTDFLSGSWATIGELNRGYVGADFMKDAITNIDKINIKDQSHC